MQSLASTSVLAIVLLTSVNETRAESHVFGNQFAKIDIQNPTNTTITYQYRWANGGVQTVTLAPGGSYSHWWEYARINQNLSPRFYISFDLDRTTGYVAKEYELPLYAVQDLGQAGREYQFEITDFSRRWLDLRYWN
jgi:hypothetical protein